MRYFAPQECDELKKRYEEEGYVVVDGIYDDTELSAMDRYFEDFKHSGAKLYKGGKTHQEIDPTRDILRAMHPHRISEQARDWAVHPRVAQVLEHVMGRAPLLAQTMMYYKPPQSVGQSLHQDNFYLLSQPATCAAAWTPLDDCDEENGCLQVVPRSHREKIVCPDSETLSEEDQELLKAGKLGETHLAGREIRPVTLKRGQTMFFNGQLIHGSYANVSKTRSRRTFIGHYVDSATTSLSSFYFPLLNMQGGEVAYVKAHTGGGPCAELPSWAGAVH
ncbi:MAG: phytanoyl-CoA dioxygenase family protein [Kiritimatiellae bacterium]|jgi:phytanoyl-CoA hydroxylase|nr:phytanoyl-CoA dioxygenase family protein [Kiritimatiellia bacterium]